jgi:prophage DNA circulation protein|tara:strand:+ start:51 stop:194 length:144 start_codon:yes stop_codon:yes gene_type:complete
MPLNGRFGSMMIKHYYPYRKTAEQGKMGTWGYVLTVRQVDMRKITGG